MTKKHTIYFNLHTTYHVNNDAKRRVYGKNLAKKQKCSVPCVFYSVLATLIKKKSFVKDLFPVPANLHI